MLYAEWVHPDRVLVLPKRFPNLIKWRKHLKGRSMPTMDATVSCPNINLTCQVDNVQVLKDPADKIMEMLSKASFALAGSAMQPAVAVVAVFQSLKDQ